MNAFSDIYGVWTARARELLGHRFCALSRRPLPIRTSLTIDDRSINDQWRAKRAALAGRHQVSIYEIFRPEYILREANVNHFDDLVREAKLRDEIRSVDDMTDEERIRWDLLIRVKTRFPDWPSFLSNASTEWLRRQIEGETEPETRAQQQASPANDADPSSSIPGIVDEEVASSRERWLTLLESKARASFSPGPELDAFMNALDFMRALPPEAEDVFFDLLDLLLTLLGMVPGISAPADVVGAGLSYSRSDYLGMAISVAGVIPIVGVLPGIGKALLIVSRINQKLDLFVEPLARILRDLTSQVQTTLSRAWRITWEELWSELGRIFSSASEKLGVYMSSKKPMASGPKANAPPAPANATTPSPTPSPSPPKKEPSTLNSTPPRRPGQGEWREEDGPLYWHSTDPDVRAITNDEPIPYTKEGWPDFSRWRVGKTLDFKPGELTGDHGIDRELGLAKLVETGRFPSKAAATRWLELEELAIHHATTTRLEVVSKLLNTKVSHIGPASALRRGNEAE
jgi:hypothetical protein